MDNGLGTDRLEPKIAITRHVAASQRGQRAQGQGMSEDDFDTAPLLRGTLFLNSNFLRIAFERLAKRRPFGFCTVDENTTCHRRLNRYRPRLGLSFRVERLYLWRKALSGYTRLPLKFAALAKRRHSHPHLSDFRKRIWTDFGQ